MEGLRARQDKSCNVISQSCLLQESGPLSVCKTHVRGLLGGGCCYEELSLSGEPLLNHCCL